MKRKAIIFTVLLLFIGTNFITSTVSLNEKVTTVIMKPSAITHTSTIAKFLSNCFIR